MIECGLDIIAAIGPFDDSLITGQMDDAVARIQSMGDPIKAVQLVLATYCRSDSVIERRDLDRLAEHLGVFEDEDAADTDDGG